MVLQHSAIAVAVNAALFSGDKRPCCSHSCPGGIASAMQPPLRCYHRLQCPKPSRRLAAGALCSIENMPRTVCGLHEASTLLPSRACSAIQRCCFANQIRMFTREELATRGRRSDVPASRVFKSLNRPAASRTREKDMQKDCTSRKRSCKLTNLNYYCNTCDNRFNDGTLAFAPLP